MTDIERIRDWLQTFPRADVLRKFSVDYTDAAPQNGGVFPSGLVENGRTTDIFGNVEVQNQYNFLLYYVFIKASEDDSIAVKNADWVMAFQQWVQSQSATHKAPTFGDDPGSEIMRAQNGILYDADPEGTTAVYAVQLSATFKKKFRRI